MEGAAWIHTPRPLGCWLGSQGKLPGGGEPWLRGAGGGLVRSAPWKMVVAKAKPPSENRCWEPAMLFPVVQMPCHVKEIHISALKKESSRHFKNLLKIENEKHVAGKVKL